MRRLLSFLAFLCFGFMAVTAQVTTSPAFVYDGYTGELVLTYDPYEGSGNMSSATECYSHIGLLTENSSSTSDWKYVKPGDWGTTAEPQWTKVGDIWQLTINDFRSWFGCPDGEAITGIAMVFHNGKGGTVELLEGKGPDNSDILIDVEPTPLCMATLKMYEAYGDTWNGAELTITAGEDVRSYTIADGGVHEQDLNVPIYSETPVVTLTGGNYPDEVGFAMYGANGVLLAGQPMGNSSSEETYNLSEPCSEEANPYLLADLKATLREDGKGYDVTWGATDAASYILRVYGPDDSEIVNAWVEGTEYFLDLSEVLLDGNYRVTVEAINEDNMELSNAEIPSITCSWTVPVMGEMTVRVLLASDTQLDIEKDINIRVRDANDDLYVESAVRESEDSRWWTASFNIPTDYYTEVLVTVGGGVLIDQGAIAGKYRDKTMCLEIMNKLPRVIDPEAESVTIWHEVNRDCDVEDHDYRPTVAAEASETGQVTWTISAETYPYKYYVYARVKDSGDEYAYINDIYNPSAEKNVCGYTYNNEEAFTLEYRVLVYDEYSNELVAPVEGEVAIPANPNMPQNVKMELNEDNTMTISWDVMENLQTMYIECRDYYGYYAISTFFSAEELEVVDGRYVVVTPRKITNSGEAYLYMSVRDENNHEIAYKNLYLDITPNNLGDSKLHVLIPTDCCYDISKGVWAFVMPNGNSSDGFCVKMTEKEGRWFEADFTVNAPFYGLNLVDKDICNEGWEDIHQIDFSSIVDKESWWYIYPGSYENSWSSAVADPEMTETKLTPTDLAVTQNEDGNEVTFTITAEQKASYYYISLYQKGEAERLYKLTYTPSEEDETLSYTYRFTIQEDVEIDRVAITAYDKNGNRTCLFEKEIEFTIKPNPLIPSGLGLVLNEDNSLTLSWDAKEGVGHHYISLNKDGYYIYGESIYPSENEPVDGKYQLNYPNLTETGTYTFYVEAYDENYTYCGQKDVSLDVTALYPLGEATIRVLIPSDCNMEFAGDVWFWWWDDEHTGQWVKAHAEEGRWFEATIDALRPFYQFLVQNTGTWEGTYQQTVNSDKIAQKAACYQVIYKQEDAANWSLVESDCEAVDHDYRITDLWAYVNAPTVTLNYETLQPAPMYRVQYRVKGDVSWTTYTTYYTYGENNPINMTFSLTADTEYEFRLIPLDASYNAIANIATVSTVITANPLIPQNVTTTVNEDNTLTISWDEMENANRFYVRSYDANYTDVMNQYVYVDEITIVDGRYQVVTRPLTTTGEAYVSVTAYNENGQSGNTYFYFDVPTLTPLGMTNINVLIPSDCCFDVAGGVWFYVTPYGGVSTCVAAEAIPGDRWFSASIDLDGVFAYDLTVTNKDVCNEGWEGAATANRYSLTSNEVYFYTVKDPYYTDAWDLNTATPDQSDHNLIPTNIAVTTDDEEGTYTISFEVSDLASNYYVSIYKPGEEYAYSSWRIYPEEEETTSITRTYKSSFASPFTVGKVVIWAYGSDDMAACEPAEYTTQFDIPANPLAPRDLTLVLNVDNSIDFSWKANEGVRYYYIEGRFNGMNQKSWYVYTSNTEAVDGRYSIIWDKLLDNGEYSFRIVAYDQESNYVGEVISTPLSVTTLEPLGETTLRVLVPTDNNMNIENGVWFWWWSYDEPAQWAKATELDGRWFEATVNVTKPSFGFRVHNTGTWEGDYEQSYDWSNLTSNTVCAELQYNNGYSEWSINSAECDAADHDYRIKGVTADVSQPGVVTFTISAEDYGVYYTLYARVHDSGEYAYYGEYELDENHSFTTMVQSAEDAVYDYQFRPYGATYSTWAAGPYELAEVAVPGNAFIPQGMSAVSNEDGTYTLMWNEMEGFGYFYVWCWDYDGNFPIDAVKYTAEDLTVVDGKYQLVTPKFTVEGTAGFEVDVCNEVDKTLGYNWTSFEVVLPPLGEITQRFQIPSDNNMNINNGVWMTWWIDGETPQTVKLTPVGDRWFEATILVEDDKFNWYVANNEDASVEGTQRTGQYYSRGECWSLAYNYMPTKYYWWGDEVECGAPDHDYRIKKVNVDNSVAGQLFFTFEADDYAERYQVELREAGSSEDFEYYKTWYVSDSETQCSMLFVNLEDKNYEFKFIPYDNNWDQVADIKVITATVKANDILPTDLDAVVAADGRTVTFTWTNTNPHVSYYSLEVVDNATGWDRAFPSNIIGNTYTHVLYVPSDYSWRLFVYDDEGNYRGAAYGPDFTTTGPELLPTNLQVTVEGQTATLTWDAPDEVTECYYRIWGDGFTSSYIRVTAEDHHFTTTFTPKNGDYGKFEWGVVSGEAGSDYFISNWVYGEDFIIAEPEESVETFTLHVSANEGGWITDMVNGTYPEGTKVTIAATPYEGYAFETWSDGVTEASREITISQDTSLIASFVSTLEVFTVTISAGEHGSVNAEDANGEYDANSLVYIEAIADDGYEFSQWSDGNTTAARYVLVTQDTTLVASFVEKENTYTLHIASAGGGIVNETVNGVYEEGATVTITATADADWTFVKWSDDNTDASRVITMDQDYDLVAYFQTETTFTLTLVAEGHGAVNTEVNGTYKGGDIVHIVATPDEDYKLLAWSDGNTELERDIVISQDLTLTASFAELEYFTLTIVIEPEAAGAVTFDGELIETNKKTVLEGESIALVAEANDGYNFVRFEDGSLFINEPEYTVLMNKNKIVKAIFDKPEGFDNLFGDSDTAKKVLIDGQLYILRGGKIYTTTGALVR